MNRTQRHSDRSIVSLRATLLAHTSQKATQRALQNICLRARALQQQLHDLQQQVNTLQDNYRSTN